MRTFECPYLNGVVELSDERLAHIVERHPELRDEAAAALQETLAAPDEVRRSTRSPGSRLFCRWYTTPVDGKYVVAVVVSNHGLMSGIGL
jgi:hypothetical protein